MSRRFRLRTGAVCVVVVLIGSATGWQIPGTAEYPEFDRFRSATCKILNVDGTDVATYQQGPSILKLRSFSCMATHLRAVRYPLITTNGFGLYEKVVGPCSG
jgi:hypothetical protein